MKVGDKVHLLTSHGSCGDQEFVAGRHVGVIKDINPDHDPTVLTRCVEVLWPDTETPGISWHFLCSLVLAEESKG